MKNLNHREPPKPLECWRHFKGNDYIIIAVATNCTNYRDNQRYVVYKSLDSDVAYMHRIDEFMSEVDHEKYPDVIQHYRFEKRTCEK